MKILVFLVLLTGCNGGQYDQPSQSQVKMAQDAYWDYVQQSTMTPKDHVQDIRLSHLGQYLCSLISHSVQTVQRFFRLVYAHIVMWSNHFQHRFCQEVDHLQQHLHDFLHHLEDDTHYHTKELVAQIRWKLENIKMVAAQFIKALDPTGLKMALLEKTQELNEHLKQFFELLETHHHEHHCDHHQHHDHKPTGHHPGHRPGHHHGHHPGHKPTGHHHGHHHGHHPGHHHGHHPGHHPGHKPTIHHPGHHHGHHPGHKPTIHPSGYHHGHHPGHHHGHHPGNKPTIHPSGYHHGHHSGNKPTIHPSGYHHGHHPGHHHGHHPGHKPTIHPSGHHHGHHPGHKPTGHLHCHHAGHHHGHHPGQKPTGHHHTGQKPTGHHHTGQKPTGHLHCHHHVHKPPGHQHPPGHPGHGCGPETKKKIDESMEAFKTSLLSLVSKFEVELAQTTEKINKRMVPQGKKRRIQLIKDSAQLKEDLESLWRDWILLSQQKAD